MENNENENEMMNEENKNNSALDEDNELMYIYEWVDSIPLSRQKKNIARDFNDGVLLAEMIKHHCPRLVELHNYPNASSTKLKLSNWTTLNNKVLKKIGIKLTKDEIEDIMGSKPNAIEQLLGKVWRIVHDMPLNDNPSKNKPISEERTRDQEEQNNNQYQNQAKINTMEEEMERRIMEKDQEILEMKSYIEDLEKKIYSSNDNQSFLEGKLKQLNEIIRQNEIQF